MRACPSRSRLARMPPCASRRSRGASLWTLMVFVCFVLSLGSPEGCPCPEGVSHRGGSQRLTPEAAAWVWPSEGTPSNVLDPFFHAIRRFLGPPRVAQRENAQRNVTRRPDSSHACLSSLALRPPSVSQ